jgi:hypothetical protein
VRNYVLDTPLNRLVFGAWKPRSENVRSSQRNGKGSLLEPHFTDEDKAREYLEAMRLQLTRSAREAHARADSR